MVVKVIDSLNRSRVEMAQLRAQQQGTANVGQEVVALRQEVAQLRQQLSELRDTSTQYDLSFDTALQRMERRVEHVEQQQRRVIS